MFSNNKSKGERKEMKLEFINKIGRLSMGMGPIQKVSKAFVLFTKFFELLHNDVVPLQSIIPTYIVQ